LIFEIDLIDGEGIVALTAVSLKSRKCKTIAEDIGGLELSTGEILVIVLIGPTVIGIQGVEINDSCCEEVEE
jgi:hypothetical protein